MTVLNSCLTATGGVKAVSAIQDFTASGTITYYWAGSEVKGAANILGLGTDRFRVDATLPDGVRSWAVKGSTGFGKDQTGKVSSLPLHQVLSADTLMFFLPRMVTSLSNPSTSISYVGLEAFQGTQVHHLRLQMQPPAQIDTTGALSEIAVKDFYVDAATFLLVQIGDQAYRVDTITDSLPHTISFSNYQAVNGVIVPFIVDETLDGIRVSHVEISSLNFNVGLTDSAFDLTQ